MNYYNESLPEEINNRIRAFIPKDSSLKSPVASLLKSLIEDYNNLDYCTIPFHTFAADPNYWNYENSSRELDMDLKNSRNYGWSEGELDEFRHRFNQDIYDGIRRGLLPNDLSCLW